MVNLVNLESVSHAFGTRVPLDGMNLGVGAGEMTGMVGRNGDGKTTLLHVPTGDLVPDSGRVMISSSASIGVLTQHQAGSPGETIRQMVLDGTADRVYAVRADRRKIVEALLAGMDLDRPVGTLPGGERKRVELVEMLLGNRDLVVLDEPTNHLDVEVIVFLASRLRSRTAAGLVMLMISHDRWFLDAVCTHIWEVHNGVVDAYGGDYTVYVLTRVERQRQTAATEARRKNLTHKELAWLRRGASARTSKPKFRTGAAEALISNAPPSRDRLVLKKFATSRLGRDVFGLINVGYAVEDRTLLGWLTWSIDPNDRIRLVGVNDAGKTTLLDLLAGLRSPQSGKIKHGVTLRIGYLSQGVGELDDEDRMLQSVTRLEQATKLATGREVSASNLLEEFSFTDDKLVTHISDLSGGERRRLQFLRLLLEEPNILLLDEPTNDLDIDTLTVIGDYLDTWPGVLIVVSHDRYFLERVTDASWALLGDGSCALLPDGVEEYLERRRGTKNASPVPVPPTGDRPRSDAVVERTQEKGLACLESQLSEVESKIERIHSAMAASVTDFERLAVLDTDLRAVQTRKNELKDAWLLAAERKSASAGPGTRIPDMPIKPNPKYLTMRERLHRRILELPIGVLINSEQDLAQECGVSRTTTRRAVIDLTRRGLLSRHVGRGAFTVQPRIELRLSLSSLTDDMWAKEKKPGAAVLEFGREQANDRNFLPMGTPLVTMTRVRTGDGMPLAIEETHLDSSLVPGYSTGGAEQSLYETLGRRYGLRLDSGEQRIAAVERPKDIVGSLHVRPGAPVIRTDRKTLIRERPAEHTIS